MTYPLIDMLSRGYAVPKRVRNASPPISVSANHALLSKRRIAARPLVSVVIPAYNAEAFIAQTLESVLAQRYSNVEVLVVDDGSQDRTADIVREYIQRDERIRLLQQQNAGVAAARNLGIRASCGEFVAPIDADDVWRSDALEKMVACFHQGGERMGVAYAWSIDIDEQSQPLGGFHAAAIAGDVYRTLICHNFLGNASATLIRKSCLEQIGGYDTQLKAQNAQGCEDWDLYLRLAEQYEFGVVPEFLVGYRKVASSMSGDFRKMARSQHLMLQTVQRNHPEIPKFLYRLSRSSFYVYLAHQSHAYGNSRATLFWLWQCIKVDALSAAGRLGVYVLLVKSIAGLVGKALSLRESSMLSSSSSSDLKGVSTSVNSCSGGSLTWKVSSLKLRLKVFIGTVLHQSLSRI